MYRNILVPLDGSDTSMSGLLEAVKMAKASGSSLRLLNVFSSAVSALDYASAFIPQDDALPSKLRIAAEALLEHAQDLAQQHGAPSETILLGTAIDNIGELIIGQAKEWPADLIVMGTHGRRGLARLVLGSTAEYVLRHSPVPLLLLRHQPSKARAQNNVPAVATAGA